MVGAVGAVAIGANLPFPELFQTQVSDEGLVVALLFGAAGVFILKTGLGITLSRLTLLYLAKIETHFATQVARSIFGSTIEKLKKQSRPEIEWTILRSTHKAFTSILGNAIGFLAEISLALFIFLFLIYTDWLLALVATGYFSLILLVFHLATRRAMSAVGAEFAEESVQVINSINDLTVAFKEIRVLGKTSAFLDSLADARGAVARSQAVHDHLGAIPRLIVELGLIVGSIGFVTLQLTTGAGLADLPILGVFLVASLRIMSALLPLQRTFQFLRYDAPLATAAQDFLSRLAQEEMRIEKRELTATPPLQQPTHSADWPPADGPIGIELREVSFNYSDGHQQTPGLHAISLTVEPGSVVALMGPSGAGKSTLVDLVLGLLQPTIGHVSCGGLPPEDLRAASPGAVGYVPQKPGLVSGTIEQNIALGVPAAEVDDQALWRAITGSGLSDLIQSMPDGAKTSLGKHADSLSGGQIQRLGLARALYNSPRLLILDEATSALDPETEMTISETLKLMRGETTLLVVAHRLSTIQNADVIHVLERGKLIASGSYDYLRRSSPLVKRYAGLLASDGNTSGT